jgi:periplasmic divalent cation tolerance protein
MYIVVFITAASSAQAKKIAQALVERKFVACVNIIGSVSSIFQWKGKVDKASEVLLIAKSMKTRLPGIVKFVKSMHSYSVPEIIAMPIIGGRREYLDWIDESIR